MTVIGTTGTAQNEGGYCAVTGSTAGDLQKSQTDFESQRQAACRKARLYGPPKKPNGPTPVMPSSLDKTVETGIGAALTPQQPQTEGIKPKIPSAESSPPPNVVVPVTATVTTSIANAGSVAGQMHPNIAEFFRRVLPWSAAGSPGVANFHWSLPDRKGMGGEPFADLHSFLSYIPWANQHAKWIKDIYFCLSLQAETGLTASGKIKAARHANAALALKALWADVDGYKDYPSKTDALAAIHKFVQDSGIPLPTALVDSGGGWHVYWISDKPLTKAEWELYANGLWALIQKHGLKADPLTTDAARVLRVPGTYNKKQATPRLVEIKLLAPTDIDFTAVLGWLKGIAPPRAPTASLPRGNSPVILNPELFKGGPSAALRAAIPQQLDRLGDGIEEPLSLKAICRCPHYKEALKTGGKDHNQGLWMQTVLGATWIENSREVAHAMSDKHPTYDPAVCGAMFDRKMADRAKGMGWPGCQAFENAGCKLCATCKHKGIIKSPLTLAKAPANIAEPVKEAKPSGATDIKIDWSKVQRPGWLKSAADLPDDAPAKLKQIIGHTGNLRELNADLIQLGILKKGYGSWSDVTHAIAAGFKFYGKYIPEQIAEALLADLPCNRHVAKQQDKERAIERAISRSHEPKPKSNISGYWPDGVDDKTERPRKGILNTIEAIKRAGITCTWDEFRQKEYWSGHADKSFDGEISDAAVTVTRRNIRQKYRLYPDITETRDAITDACHDNKSNPVLDYFARLKWDGKPRLDKMFHTYWGADDTPLNAAVGRKVMCAIVRRAKRPGCKFDHQLVLQSPQGRKKSMFCEDLAVFPDLFTDAGDLSGTIKEQMEIIQGMQIIEFPELAGYGRATRERNKASLSRKNDRARLSYAHYATNQPRQSIPIATTNEGHYLNDPTGERRYWHVAVTFYDRDAFLADKDQLYAEAVACEPAEKLWLDTPELEAAHDAIVATVKAPHELVDMLADLQGEAWHVNGKDEERASTADIRRALGLTEADAVRSHNIGQRIADAMKTLGWTKAPDTIRCHCHKNDAPGQFCSKKDQPTTGYTRPIPAGSGPTGATGPQGAQDSTGPGPTGPTGPAGAQGYTGPWPVDPQNTPPLQPVAEAGADVGMPDEADAEMDEHIKRIRAQALELGAGNKALTQGFEKGLAHSQAAFALLKGNG